LLRELECPDYHREGREFESRPDRQQKSGLLVERLITFFFAQNFLNNFFPAEGLLSPQKYFQKKNILLREFICTALWASILKKLQNY